MNTLIVDMPSQTNYTETILTSSSCRDSPGAVVMFSECLANNHVKTHLSRKIIFSS